MADTQLMGDSAMSDWLARDVGRVDAGDTWLKSPQKPSFPTQIFLISSRFAVKQPIKLPSGCFIHEKPICPRMPFRMLTDRL